MDLKKIARLRKSINRAQRMGEAKQEAAQLNRRAGAETDAEQSNVLAENRARTSWDLYRLEKEAFERGSELAPSKMPTPPTVPDPDSVDGGECRRDNSNAVLAGFMQETR